MPVAALMTLFSSGVQGVGVRGWTLPDGSWDRGTVPTTACGKEKKKKTQNTHKFTAKKKMEQQNSLKSLPSWPIPLDNDESRMKGLAWTLVCLSLEIF